MSYFQSARYLFPVFGVQDAVFLPKQGSWFSRTHDPEFYTSSSTLYGSWPQPARSHEFASRWQKNQKHDRTPPLRYDVVQRSDGYLLSIDLPGIAPEEIKVEVSRDILTVSRQGIRKENTDPAASEEPAHDAAERAENDNIQSTRGRHSQHVARWSFKLGKEIDLQSISGTLKYGVLDIILPKIPAPEPKRIEIALN